jgi:hypothetical protein
MSARCVLTAKWCRRAPEVSVSQNARAMAQSVAELQALGLSASVLAKVGGSTARGLLGLRAP